MLLFEASAYIMGKGKRVSGFEFRVEQQDGKGSSTKRTKAREEKPEFVDSQ
jgi:hypothetical protein